MSGLGEACSHVAGLLFAVNDFILRGFRSLPDSQSTTDVLCKWSKPSEGRKVDAVPLSEVPVRKAVSGGRKAQTKWERDDPLSKYDPRLPETRRVVVDGDHVVCLAEELRGGVGYCGLVMNYDNERRLPEATTAATRVCGPKSLPDTVLEFDCAVLPSSEIELSATSSFSTQRSESLLEKRQALLFNLAGPVPVLDDEAVPGLAKHAERITEAMRLSADEIEDLKRSTVAQSDSERWHAEHVGRITASLSHRAMRAAASRAPDKVVRDTMRYRETQNSTRKQLKESDPRQHGLRLKPLARQAYVQHKHRQGQGVSVDECGLLVSQANPYLATSTDGYVTESGTDGTGVLEIKCPVTNMAIPDFAATKKNCFLGVNPHGGLSLKESHQYYTQVQFEMTVSGCLWADFVVFSLPDDDGDDDDDDDDDDDHDHESLFVQRILFCESFWEKKLFPALSKFFCNFVVLELLTRRVQRNVPLLNSI